MRRPARSPLPPTSDGNIHREVVDLQPEGRAVACREALNNRVVRAKDQALAVLRNVYGLEVTEDAP